MLWQQKRARQLSPSPWLLLNPLPRLRVRPLRLTPKQALRAPRHPRERMHPRVKLRRSDLLHPLRKSQRPPLSPPRRRRGQQRARATLSPELVGRNRTPPHLNPLLLPLRH